MDTLKGLLAGNIIKGSMMVEVEVNEQVAEKNNYDEVSI